MDDANKIFEERIYRIPVYNKDSVQKRGGNKNFRIDLHGQTLEAAKNKVVQSIRTASVKGLKKIVFITGKGKNSPGISSVLRDGLDNFLLENRNELKISYEKKDGEIMVCLKG